MKTNLYCITDVKANRTLEPFSSPTDASAKRSFIFGCIASETPIQDCILWRLGNFSVSDDNQECFKLEALPTPVVVNPTIEEIEAYSKLFDDNKEKFEEFESKGVI